MSAMSVIYYFKACDVIHSVIQEFHVLCSKSISAELLQNILQAFISDIEATFSSGSKTIYEQSINDHCG